jgi:predicted DNA-binding protein YlxM (UPF0122 family)
MRDDRLLNKANRVNMLLDFYAPLLTEKQVTFMRLQYEEDLSLSEISEQFDVSRQAVNDHNRRACDLLEDYEQKLMLFDKHTKRNELYTQLLEQLNHMSTHEALTLRIVECIQALKRLEEG